MTPMLESIRANIGKYVALSDAEFDMFAGLLQHRHLEKKAPLLVAGEVCDFEGYVVNGCLRVYHTDESGADHVLYFAPEDWWVADVGSLISQTPAVLSMDALEPTEVLLIDRASKERLYGEVPKFERVFRIMSERALVAMQGRVMGMMRETADVRYHDFKRGYPNLEHRVPQHQIAAYLGISPEFLSRIRHRHGAPPVSPLVGCAVQPKLHGGLARSRARSQPAPNVRLSDSPSSPPKVGVA